MNKKLISVVIGAALAGGYSVAQADVQLYGTVNMSIDSFDSDYDSGINSVISGKTSTYTNSDSDTFDEYDLAYGAAYGGAGLAAILNGGGDDINMNSRTSFIGVKGSEDLGNGLKAIFKLEFNVSGPDESGGLSGRDQWVGLTGDFGTVRLGAMGTHYKESGTALDPFGNTALDMRGSTLSDFSSLGFMSPIHDSTSHDAGGRSRDTVRYDTPDFNGISGAVHYSFDDSESDGEDEDSWGIGGQFKNDSMYAFASYITTESGGEDDAWKIGGSYSMGNASLFGQYEQGGLLSFGVDEDANQWMLGGTFTMGNTMLLGAYGQYQADYGSLVSGADVEYDIWQLAAMHNLSKRTGVYAGFNQSDVDGLGEVDHFSIGVQHKF